MTVMMKWQASEEMTQSQEPHILVPVCLTYLYSYVYIGWCQ